MRVKEVYFGEDYPESEADAIASRYGIPLVKLTEFPQVIPACRGPG